MITFDDIVKIVEASIRSRNIIMTNRFDSTYVYRNISIINDNKCLFINLDDYTLNVCYNDDVFCGYNISIELTDDEKCEFILMFNRAERYYHKNSQDAVINFLGIDTTKNRLDINDLNDEDE